MRLVVPLSLHTQPKVRRRVSVSVFVEVHAQLVDVRRNVCRAAPRCQRGLLHREQGRGEAFDSCSLERADGGEAFPCCGDLDDDAVARVGGREVREEGVNALGIGDDLDGGVGEKRVHLDVYCAGQVR